jgi:hypothetical protein
MSAAAPVVDPAVPIRAREQVELEPDQAGGLEGCRVLGRRLDGQERRVLLLKDTEAARAMGVRPKRT